MAMNNDPKADILCPSASTYHHGQNTGKIELNGEEYIERSAYQRGKYLGTDQRNHTIGQLTPDMVDLMSKVKEAMLLKAKKENDRYYLDHPELLDFNELDIKVFYTYRNRRKKDGKIYNVKKHLNWHTDSKHDPATKRGAPVVICSFGAAKSLGFRKMVGGKVSINPGDTFYITQPHGTVLAVDPRDELGTYQVNGTYYEHSPILEVPDGVSCSIMLRVVDQAAPVDLDTNKLAPTHQWSTDKRNKEIPIAESKLARDQHFMAEKKRILKMIKDTIEYYKKDD